MRVILELQYNGKEFCGWQRQPDKRTVQEEIEHAVYKITGKHSSVIASGRTDSGVHALCQVAHFDTESNIPPERFSYALNTVLPSDIKVTASFSAPDGFHSRFSATKKTYRYTFYISKCELPLLEPYAKQIYFADEKKMQAGANYIVGEHDFACFLATDSDVKGTVRKVYSCKVALKGKLLTVTICGNGFLYNMVRIIAGTLLAVGQNKILPEDVQSIIDGKVRNPIGKTMEAKGLMLLKVCYSSKNNYRKK